VLEGPDGPAALPVVEAIPQERDLYDFEARY
jgi:D-alanine-D-alanine ligase